MEQNFSPGLALIDLSGTGPWRVEQTLRRKTKAYFSPLRTPFSSQAFARLPRSKSHRVLDLKLPNNNTQTRGGLGWVCATGIYRSIGHVELPKFQTGIFVEWKAPLGTTEFGKLQSRDW